MKLYICEKPSQGRDIAKVLSTTQYNDGYQAFYKSIQNNTKLANASDLQKRTEQNIKGKV